MADNEKRGARESFRREQRRRREPPIIDATAADVTPIASETEPPQIADEQPVSHVDRGDAGAALPGEPEPAGSTRSADQEAGHRDGVSPHESIMGPSAEPAPPSVTETYDEAASKDLGPAAHTETPAADASPSHHDASPRGEEPVHGEVHDLTATDALAASSHEAEDVAAASSEAAGEHLDPRGDEPPPLIAEDAPVHTPPSWSGEPPPAAVPQASRLPMLLGAAILALVAGIAVLLWTEPQRTGAADLTVEVNQLKDQLAALQARPSADPAQISAIDDRSKDLAGQLTALKANVADLGGKLDAVVKQAQGDAGRIAALEKRGTEAAQTTATQPAAPAPPSPPVSEPPSAGATAPATSPTVEAPTPASSADLSALATKVEDLEKRVAALPASPPSSEPAPAAAATPSPNDLGPLTSRVDALQADVAAIPKIDLAPIRAQLDDLSKQLTEAAQANAVTSAALAALPKVDLEPLKTATADLDKKVGALEATLSAPKAGDRVTEARAVGDADTSRAAPLAVVAQAVGHAIDDGRPFPAELDALKALGVDGTTLAPLTPLAGKGAPTVETLKAQWSAVEPVVLKAIQPTGQSALDRFAAGARSLVQVHAVGAAPAGDSPAALAGRVGAALDRGDLSGALAEWAKLPDAGRAVSQAWADAARSRLDAATSAQALVSHAIGMLGKAGG